eukprot:CAMPEP_0195042434 /NCGR_PEP_ID=MMETSP0347-20130606/2590_1 /TAXON_ID=2932 /ORGANISM="Alexandrium fundyense, Strain CCMP1719" /LENGTH=40 /DNA_ID= /DNA_START= /DNA_END= /DNA_ORIENTATION=
MASNTRVLPLILGVAAGVLSLRSLLMPNHGSDDAAFTAPK